MIKKSSPVSEERAGSFNGGYCSNLQYHSPNHQLDVSAHLPATDSFLYHLKYGQVAYHHGSRTNLLLDLTVLEVAVHSRAP